LVQQLSVCWKTFSAGAKIGAIEPAAHGELLLLFRENYTLFLAAVFVLFDHSSRLYLVASISVFLSKKVVF